jgi:broad specificity phosphatase PhoE/CTP:molybdopterin cytidylyltransferase MocA
MGDEMMAPGKIVGLILTAGYSSRMGSFKPLLPIGDMNAIERVSDSMKKAGIETVIGVTGFQRERLSSIFAEKGIREAYNQDFEQGMFSSIRTGVAAAMAAGAGAPEGFLLFPVDCPLVPPQVLSQILNKHWEEPDAFIVPCYRGKKGHPLFIPAQYGPEILEHGGEGGLKAVMSRHEGRLIRLETGTEAVVLDMDTPEGYQEILEHHRNQTAGTEEPDNEDLIRSLHGKRLFLIRHGETRQHREKIFLGQTDVPLSDRGREQAAEAAAELIDLDLSADRIYASDLSRAAETAEIIREVLARNEKASGNARAKIPVIPEPRLREMSLGEWDGRFISEIREQYPEEYEKRGADLPTYKFGNDSENYFDLQYRAMKGLRSILERERIAGDSRDIVIVSHTGVINVLLSNLRRTKLEDEIKNRLPNGGVCMIDYSNMKEK